MLVWTQYITDIRRTYPFLPVAIKQISDLYREDSPLLILPEIDQGFVINFNSSCSIKELTPRKIRLFFSDDSVYQFDYYRPFDATLFNWLSNSISVRAFELIGEEIRYSRLRRMLNNV